MNSLPNNKILDLSKLKALAIDKIIICGPNIEICLEKGRKHCGKRRKSRLAAFSPFLKMFSKLLFLGAVQSRNSVVKG